MMQRVVLVLVLAAALLVPRLTFSLVEPALSGWHPQPWQAQIYVKDDINGHREFCKGTLIDAQWILTSGYCIFDPFEALGRGRSEAGKSFVVQFAGSDEYHAIEKFVKSPDLAAGMMKLVNPVAIEPARLSTRSAADLLNTKVFILGTESTAPVGDVYYNPDMGPRMNCSIDGKTYFRTGAICYLMPKLVRSSGLVETQATVIDPSAPGAPNSPLDTVQPFDMTGRRLYLDFRGDASYPCNEDLGAAVLRTDAAGAVEVAGIVSAVGMAAFPLCNPSLRNVFGSVAAYQEFIHTTLAQEIFDQLCPASPEPRVEYAGLNGVRVSWDAVAGATGYRLMYTSHAGHVPFTTLDVGSKTAVSTSIGADLIYRVFLVAYNAVCASPMSRELAVTLQ